MIDVKSIIELARKRYREDGVTLHLPHRNHIESPYPRASSLGLCALQSAYQKARKPSDFKSMAENEWLMDHGNYVAPMIQLPLMWWAMGQPGSAFIPERPFISHEHKVAGRLDGLLEVSGFHATDPSQMCVIEIKDTEGKVMRSVGEPTLRYGYQTLVYMMVFGVSQGAVVTCSKWDYTVWNLIPEDKGYRFYGEDGLPYFPSYGTNWNTPNRLNIPAVQAMLVVMNDTLDAVRAGEAFNSTQTDPNRLPPIADPLNDPALGWLCLRKENPTARKKEGWARPSCQWCQSCHGLEDKFYTTVKVDERIVFKS